MIGGAVGGKDHVGPGSRNRAGSRSKDVCGPVARQTGGSRPHARVAAESSQIVGGGQRWHSGSHAAGKGHGHAGSDGQGSESLTDIAKADVRVGDDRGSTRAKRGIHVGRTSPHGGGQRLVGLRPGENIEAARTNLRERSARRPEVDGGGDAGVAIPADGQTGIGSGDCAIGQTQVLAGGGVIDLASSRHDGEPTGVSGGVAVIGEDALVGGITEGHGGGGVTEAARPSADLARDHGAIRDRRLCRIGAGAAFEDERAGSRLGQAAGRAAYVGGYGQGCS